MACVKKAGMVYYIIDEKSAFLAEGRHGMGLHDGHRARKREQFRQNGLDGFADHEVLELLLYYAIPRQDTNETAHRLLQKFGSLQGVFDAPAEELSGVPGVGEGAALFLTLLNAVQKRAMRSGGRERILNSVDKCGRFFLELLSHERRECLYQVCLDAKGKLLSCKKLSQGSADCAALSIRQVVENALLSGASAVVLAHNHPSGVALPSESDRTATLWIRDALKPMDIRLLDHIIVADGDFVSMNQSGYLL